MTVTGNTGNLASTSTSNLLDNLKILPSLEESTAERTSDVALRTLQQQLSLVSQNQDQLSTELKKISLKLSLILQNQDQLSKEIKELHKQPCPPPPPPPPFPFKLNLKNEGNGKTSIEQKQREADCNHEDKPKTLDNNSLSTLTSKDIKDHIEEIQLKWAAKNNAYSISQNSTTPILETKPTPQHGTNLHRSKSMYVKGNNKKGNEIPEVKESTTFAERLAQFKSLSQKPN